MPYSKRPVVGFHLYDTYQKAFLLDNFETLFVEARLGRHKILDAGEYLGMYQSFAKQRVLMECAKRISDGCLAQLSHHKNRSSQFHIIVRWANCCSHK